MEYRLGDIMDICLVWAFLRREVLFMEVTRYVNSFFEGASIIEFWDGYL